MKLSFHIQDISIEKTYFKVKKQMQEQFFQMNFFLTDEITLATAECISEDNVQDQNTKDNFFKRTWLGKKFFFFKVIVSDN